MCPCIPFAPLLRRSSKNNFAPFGTAEMSPFHAGLITTTVGWDQGDVRLAPTGMWRTQGGVGTPGEEKIVWCRTWGRWDITWRSGCFNFSRSCHGVWVWYRRWYRGNWTPGPHGREVLSTGRKVRDDQPQGSSGEGKKNPKQLCLSRASSAFELHNLSDNRE